MSGSSQKRRASTSAASAKNTAQARNSTARPTLFMVELTLTLRFGVILTVNAGSDWQSLRFRLRPAAARGAARAGGRDRRAGAVLARGNGRRAGGGGAR